MNNLDYHNIQQKDIQKASKHTLELIFLILIKISILITNIKKKFFFAQSEVKCETNRFMNNIVFLRITRELKRKHVTLHKQMLSTHTTLFIFILIRINSNFFSYCFLK